MVIKTRVLNIKAVCMLFNKYCVYIATAALGINIMRHGICRSLPCELTILPAASVF